MDTILDSKTSVPSSETSNKSVRTRAASAPIIPVEPSVEEIKKQISAPSYFYSLRENEAPPFLKPGKEPKPKLLIGRIFNEEEVIAMIAAGDGDKENGLKNFISEILLEKKIIRNYELAEKKFLISLLLETIDYAAQRDFNAFKLAALLTIYLDSHCYFKYYYWQTPVNVWNYFKEIMIRHTVENSPDGQELFEPAECYNILTHFHTIYLSNLPLIHIITFGSYKLKFLWPFKGNSKYLFSHCKLPNTVLDPCAFLTSVFAHWTEIYDDYVMSLQAYAGGVYLKVL